MIKLTDLIKEEIKGEVSYPSNHQPFMYSPKGFSCAVCKYYSYENDQHICGNKYYETWNGSEVMDIKDPTQWCSDWFQPKQQ
jgi:hypothetical protein